MNDTSERPSNDATKVEEIQLDIAEVQVSDSVAQLIEHACALGASDLFFLTEERQVSVMVKHLGILQKVSRLTPDFGRRCMAHIKNMAAMDVTERRRPLDGRWIYPRQNGHVVDLRISTIPSLYGEDYAMRLLDRESQLLNMEQLGLLSRDRNHLLKMLGSPSGLILVTGPTGSGKTTTLYSCLTHLNDGSRKINTIEDPIEYAIYGVRQSQINQALDVDFAELLRAAMRQAPDVIMIGEIRDKTTAATAIRAANSGHLVLATLHAPITAAAVQSMLSFDVTPYHLASCLLGVVAQRLVRTLDEKTKVPYDMSMVPSLFDEVEKWLDPDEGKNIYGPSPDRAKRHMAYTGRTGVFEILPVTRSIRQFIVNRHTTQEIRQRAIEEGMIELRQAALLAIARGITSVEEVFRAIPSEYLVAPD